MTPLRWAWAVFLSRWQHRLRYVWLAPTVYRNWWAMPLAKLGVPVELRLRNGLRYRIRPGTADLGVVNEASLLNPYLAPGYVTVGTDAVVVDVGANIGDFTMQAARLCPQGRVVAVEPLSAHVRQIRLHADLNGFGHVTSVRAALGATDGVADIEVTGLTSRPAAGGVAAERVPQQTLASLLREAGLTHVDLLKLDCEGAEWDILPAARDLLPHIAQICMEYHCEREWTPERLAAWLRERGYRVWHTSGSWNGLLWAVRAD